MKYRVRKYETGLLGTNTWLISDESPTAIVIDPGGQSSSLVQDLKALYIDRIEIMLTHGHFDHTAGIPFLIEQFPDYALWIHKADTFYLGDGSKMMHRKSFAQLHAEYLVDELKKDLPEPTGYLSENERINGFSILHTPGHTEGSVCLWREEDNILFSGDTLFFRSYGRTDLLGGNEMMIHQSLRKLFLTLPAETIVYPGHGASTTIGDEKRIYR
ncbi:MAG: MBL fold metallo-hydrolase [Treponema sp.]